MQHLLLLHGAIGAKDQLALLESKLEKDYIIHRLNFSGHGGNSMPESYSIELFASDIHKYISENKIDTVNIFGYSMGGYVGLYLSKHYPGLVNKIFTLGTKFLWNPEIAQKEAKMLNVAKIEEKVPAFAKALEKRHQPNNWKEVLEKTAIMMNAMGNNNPLKLNDFTTIEHQVQIGIGDKDMMVTLEETIDVYRQLKNASFIVLPNTQHPIEKVDMDRLANEIRAFFN